MDEKIGGGLSLTFNGPLEAGVRTVALLGAAFPAAYDIQRLTALDYLLVRTGRLGGPENLHPDTPIQTPATEVRRRLVQNGLVLMMSRDLIQRELHADGIRYRAGEAAELFLNALSTPYLIALKDRATWLIDHLRAYTDAEFYALIRRFFEDWVMEFQSVERSLGITE
jgi:hypothetical protein